MRYIDLIYMLPLESTGLINRFADKGEIPASAVSYGIVLTALQSCLLRYSHTLLRYSRAYFNTVHYERGVKVGTRATSTNGIDQA